MKRNKIAVFGVLAIMIVSHQTIQPSLMSALQSHVNTVNSHIQALHGHAESLKANVTTLASGLEQMKDTTVATGQKKIDELSPAIQAIQQHTAKITDHVSKLISPSTGMQHAAPYIHSSMPSDRTMTKKSTPNLKGEINAMMMEHIKKDSLQDFQNDCVAQIVKTERPALLRVALHNNAHSIVNYLIQYGLFDINKDPAVITWTALWNRDRFEQLRPYFTKSALNDALNALHTGFFKEMKPADINKARSLLVDAGAVSQTV